MAARMCNDCDNIGELMQVIDGLRVTEGLAALAGCLIIVAKTHGFSKHDAVAAFAESWDRYEHIVGDQPQQLH